MQVRQKLNGAHPLTISGLRIAGLRVHRRAPTPIVRSQVEDLPDADERDDANESSAPRHTRHHRTAWSVPVAPDSSDHSVAYHYRRLAAELVAGCVDTLKVPRPRSAKAVPAWESKRRAEVEFIANPRASAFWCEAAGVEWDVVVSKLRAKGLIAA